MAYEYPRDVEGRSGGGSGSPNISPGEFVKLISYIAWQDPENMRSGVYPAEALSIVAKWRGVSVDEIFAIARQEDGWEAWAKDQKI